MNITGMISIGYTIDSHHHEDVPRLKSMDINQNRFPVVGAI